MFECCVVNVAYINTKLVNYELNKSVFCLIKTHNLLYCFVYVNDWQKYVFLKRIIKLKY